jgi:hypothetical protein
MGKNVVSIKNNWIDALNNALPNGFKLTQNKLFHNYWQSDLDQTWTLDLTFCFGYWVLLIQDITTRRLIAHSQFPPEKRDALAASTDDVLKLLSVCFNDYQVAKCMHTHKGSQFANFRFADF